MKRTWQTITGLNIVLALVAVNVLVSFLPNFQLDLTKDKLHSLSGTSKEVIKNIDDVVKVKVFVTNDLPPEVAPIAKDLKTVLKEFERLNRSKLQITFYDPNKDGTAKAEADKYGIQTLQFSSIKSDKLEVQNGYFGLVMLYGDKQEVLPVVSDVGNLEYFMISGIKKLTNKQLPVVALAEEETNLESTSSIQYLRKFLARSYDVKEAALDGEENIPENSAVLVIAGRTKKIDEKGLKKIEDWIGRGKGLVAFLDRINVNQNMQAVKNDETGLEKLLADKGIKLEDKLVVDDNSAIANFQTKNGSYLVKYPYWPQIKSENMNQSIPILSGINSLSLAWASPIEMSNGAKALFTSSDDSWVDDSFNDITPLSKQSDGKSKGKYVLGAIKTDEVKLAVIGDEEMIKDQFVVNNQQNLIMALNLVDYFSQDSSLFQIRSKILKSNPLKTISDQEKLAVKWINITAPILILIVTYSVARWQRKRKIKSWYGLEEK